mmetsp:Transcript_66356/g.186907  ORF Transcript_66356/g.186907 Transcript_66356/m.186907 type:complete len:221 (-) Transcript_66356:1022-1684(-)
MAVGRENTGARPDLGAVVAIDLHHPHEHGVVLFSPQLEVREVQREDDLATHDRVAHEEAVGLDEGVVGVHVPEPAHGAPKAVCALRVLRVLQVEVYKTVRALHELGYWSPEAHGLAQLRVWALPELVPEGHLRLVPNAWLQPDHVHLEGRERHRVWLLRDEAVGRRANVLPGSGAQRPELDGDAGERRDHGERLPPHAHVVPVRVNNEQPGLLGGAGNAR